MLAENIQCPVCNGKSKFISLFKREFILEQLELYYSERPPAEIILNDYEMLRCENCCLEYAYPLEAGSQSFYQWITNHSGYYPHDRWEWFTVIEQMGKTSSVSVNLLEIGSGSGKFLEMATQNLPNLQRGVGLDTTETSVKTCQDKGLEVYPETLENFLLNASKDSQENFDYIVAFHCLEHINNPKNLIKCMLRLLKPKGSIFLSTPYSPMSFENAWFDPLNHPPHHLTRWNASAYKELARQFGLEVKLFMPQAQNLINRTLYALNLAENGPAHLVSRWKTALSALQHPFVTFRELQYQSRRQKVNDQIAADVVLVELTRN